MKYLGIIIDKNLNWHHQINNVAGKLNRTNDMLSKIKHFVNFNTLKSLFHAIFESRVNYSLPVWALNANSFKRLGLTKEIPENYVFFEKKSTYI